MPAEEFQPLAMKIKILDPSADWFSVGLKHASGRMSGTVFDGYSCALRPLENRDRKGLVFEIPLIPIPPDKSNVVVNDMIQQMNGMMFLSTGHR